LLLWDDDRQENTKHSFSWENTDYATEELILSLSLGEICENGTDGLFWYSVIVETSAGALRISEKKGSYRPDVKDAGDGFDGFQLTVYESNMTTPDWMKGNLMYHVFVDRFCRVGDTPIREDAVFEEDWDNYAPEYSEIPGGFVRNNRFYGGNLYGVAEKLEYIKSLGVGVLYLSPVFEAYSNHKYDTGDYEKIDEMFGSDEAMDALLKKAKELDIRVLLDGVFNHTGSDSKYFNKTGRYGNGGAYNDKSSPYYSWFDFKDYPDKYRCWWDIDILPAVTTTDETYNEYINGENGIVRKWLRRGVSGWRLDVADELNEGFLVNLKAAARAEKSDALVLGEVWEDASNKVAYSSRRRYFRGFELDSVMNYPLKNAIIDFVKNGNSQGIKEVAISLYAHYPKDVSDCLMNFLGTHDTERILTALSDVDTSKLNRSEQANLKLEGADLVRAKELLKLAYTLTVAMPGVPCIFYGDEAGTQGCTDPFNRTTYPWGREDKELVSHYRKMGNLRLEEKLLKRGYLKVQEETQDGVFAFYRFDEENAIYAAFNQGDERFEIKHSGIDLISGKEVKNGDFLKKNMAVLVKIYK
jgi:glycosidase